MSNLISLPEIINLLSAELLEPDTNAEDNKLIITKQPPELLLTPEGKRLIFIDASSLKNYTCNQAFFWTVKESYQKINAYSKHALSYGSAIHIFLEHFYKGLLVSECLALAVKYYTPFHETLSMSDSEFRTMSNLQQTCLVYAKRYPRNVTEDFKPHQDNETNKTVEYKFAIPLWSNNKYQLVLSGTVDLPCSYLGYPLLLVDHKTSSMHFAKAKEYMSGYSLDIQTMLYSKVYKEILELDTYPPVMINGIFIKKPTKIASDKGLWDGVNFYRSNIIAYSEEQMEDFNIWFDRTIGEIINIISLATASEDAGENYNYNYNIASCKSSYGHCKFFEVCNKPRRFHQTLLNQNYIVKQYNPLAFR